MQFNKSTKLDNVLYDVRGPVVEEADRMTDNGLHVLKLNIGNPALFGFRAPDEVIIDIKAAMVDSEAIPTPAASSPPEKPSCSTRRSSTSPT